MRDSGRANAPRFLQLANIATCPVVIGQVGKEVRAVLTVDDQLEMSLHVFLDREEAGAVCNNVVGIIFKTDVAYSEYELFILLLQSKDTHAERIGFVSCSWEEDSAVRERFTRVRRRGHGLTSSVQFALQRRGEVVIA